MFGRMGGFQSFTPSLLIRGMPNVTAEQPLQLLSSGETYVARSAKHK